ncbi:hypothetical protein HY839_03085 [Candidatus Azambacteria bacterium]|nr:hypothetical protein [Candidatus Azambacteria bacterium]
MKHTIYITLLFVVLLAPVAVFAFAPDSALGNIPAGSTTIGASTAYSGTQIADKITNVVNWFSWFIALAAVVMGLYAGFLFITARGEPAQLKTARATLLWAVIGIAVAVLAFSLVAISKAIFTLV